MDDVLFYRSSYSPSQLAKQKIMPITIIYTKPLPIITVSLSPHTHRHKNYNAVFFPYFPFNIYKFEIEVLIHVQYTFFCYKVSTYIEICPEGIYLL